MEEKLKYGTFVMKNGIYGYGIYRYVGKTEYGANRYETKCDGSGMGLTFVSSNSDFIVPENQEEAKSKWLK